MMSRYFDEGRVYRPLSAGISVGIFDEAERVLVIEKLEHEEERVDIGLLFENREEAAEYFQMALRVLES